MATPKKPIKISKSKELAIKKKNSLSDKEIYEEKYRKTQGLKPSVKAFVDCVELGNSTAGECYLEHLTKKQITKANANKYAHDVLNRPAVKIYIEELRNRLARQTDITIPKIIRQHDYIAFGRIDFVERIANADDPVHEMTLLSDEEQAKIADVVVIKRKIGKDIEETKVYLKLEPAQPSLDALAKYTGMYAKDNLQQNTLSFDESELDKIYKKGMEEIKKRLGKFDSRGEAIEAEIQRNMGLVK